MRHFPLDPASLSAHERLRAVARLLAAGLHRLRERPALSPAAPQLHAENLDNSSQNCLALSSEKSVTVHNG